MKLAARLAIARLRSALNAPREARRRAPLRRAMARRNAGTIKDEGNSVYTFLLTLPRFFLVTYPAAPLSSRTRALSQQRCLCT